MCRVDEIVDWFINKGCAGIFAVSPTSEMSYLTEEERLQLATAVVKYELHSQYKKDTKLYNNF